MLTDNETAARRMTEWAGILAQFDLPDWDRLPQLDLYMDQVIILLKRYLSPVDGDEDDRAITASIINNYVRLKVMPAPVRKRYYRSHLAYAVMICALKQSLTLTEIQKILPPSLAEEEVRHIYTDFRTRMWDTAMVFIDQVNAVAGEVLNKEGDQGCTSLVLHSAVSSVLYKLLTVKLTGLQIPPAEETKT